MTSEASRLHGGAEKRVVELVPGVRMTHYPVGETELYVRFEHAGTVRSRGRNGVSEEQNWLVICSVYISERWTNLALYGLCFDWYTRFLFLRWGGLRACVRAARQLKVMRDACREARRIVDKRVSEPSRSGSSRA